MMLHPATVHFAMVLPLVAAGFGVAHLFNKSEIMSKLTARLTVIAAIAMIGVWYTGSQAGPQIYQYLSEAGKHELIEHKNLGLYLAIAMAVIAVLQFVGCKMKKFAIQALATLLLVVTTGVTFLQGKHGGEIVYEHGQPFQMHQLTNYINTNDDLQFAENAEEAIGLIKDEATTISEETSAKLTNDKVTHKESDED